jgi:outer membrane receptor protein involved in Fe transport
MQSSCFVAAILACVSAPALAAPEPVSQTSVVSPVVVTAITPLSGSVRPASVAAPVRSATAAQIESSHALDLTAFLNRTLGSVYINDVQNNPLQPDINYRGYTASPLLGTAQGLSVYMDGMRLNQPFGDVVSWDLIPKAAIASLALIPGSNPLFGLNTLGGALSIKTKDGLSDSGSTLSASYGSYHRMQVEAETGGHAANGFHWYLTANKFHESGWREHSPSAAVQAFAKAGWITDHSSIAAAVSYADTDLTGNGLQDQRLLSRDYASIYTQPDKTRNRAGFVNVTAGHDFSTAVRFSGNAYYRKIDTWTLNGDINTDSLGENVLNPNAAERRVLADAGYIGVLATETAANTPFPKFRCIADILLNTEPNEKCDGLINRSAVRQDEYGLSGQLTFDGTLGGRPNQLTGGAAYTASHAHFIQNSQFGYLAPDHGVVAVAGPGAFADGTQASENAFDARVDFTGRTEIASLYATDTLEILPRMNLTLSGRYDGSAVRNFDAITPSGAGSLTGSHTFASFNPAVGLTYAPSANLTAYFGYGQGSRAPSAIELGCSDPDSPCRLPNALAGDPPLKQVIARTFEGGLRGAAFGRMDWRAGFFRSDNTDDIQFVADSVSGFGYFKNVGRTRRQGVELAANGHFAKIKLGADYTYLNATYQSRQIVSGQGNSTNTTGAGFDGDIAVASGDHIALIPTHIFKANAVWDLSRGVSINADLIAVGGSYARGNENNRHTADGVYYLGPGRTDAYAVVNLGAEYRFAPDARVFVQVSNLFDTRYATAAQLGSTGFTASGAFLARPFAGPTVGGEFPSVGTTFLAPGAPRLLSGGVQYRF